MTTVFVKKSVTGKFLSYGTVQIDVTANGCWYATTLDMDNNTTDVNEFINAYGQSKVDELNEWNAVQRADHIKRDKKGDYVDALPISVDNANITSVKLSVVITVAQIQKAADMLERYEGDFDLRYTSNVYGQNRPTFDLMFHITDTPYSLETLNKLLNEYELLLLEIHNEYLS
jgi:hypothetical protein